MAQLTTTFYDNLKDDDIVLSEYPRPQFKRDSYLCLNGYWDYKITKDINDIKNFSEKIRVPFPIETYASTVNKTLKENEYIIYHTTFKVAKDFIKDKTLIHFLGVDQTFKIILNGVEYEEKAPMYLPSFFDISNAIKEENELFVICKDKLDIIINKEDNITRKLVNNMLNCLKELEKKYPKNIEIIDKEE